MCITVPTGGAMRDILRKYECGRGSILGSAAHQSRVLGCGCCSRAVLHSYARAGGEQMSGDILFVSASTVADVQLLLFDYVWANTT